MKKEFSPGDYCRFPNEQIPRILDILKANGHKVSAKTKPNDKHDFICVHSELGHLFPSQFRPTTFPTELTPHDFLVIALRLEEGIGFLEEGTTKDQREQIVLTIASLGVRVNCSMSDCVCVTLPHEFRGGIFMSVLACENPIPYEEWCRRLCVEPIECNGNCSNYCDTNGCVERKRVLVEPIGMSADDVLQAVLPDNHPMKTLEQHVDEYDAGKFDPTKPFTFGAGWTSSIHNGKPVKYIGTNSANEHVIEFEDGSYGTYHTVRNIHELTANMLREGETMIVEQSDIPDVVPGNIIFRYSAWVLNMSNWKRISRNDSPKVFGRKVSIESAEFKIIEP